MNYTPFDVVHGVVSFAALTVMLYLVVRSPWNVRRWALTGLIAGWAIAYPLGIAASAGTDILGMPPMTARAIQHGLLMLAAFSLMCLFLFSALESARRRALREAAILLAALVVLTVAALSIPDTLRVAAAAVPATPGKGPLREPAVAVFYITANSYMLYGFAGACRWTARYARHAEPGLRRALRTASVGLGFISAAIAVFVAANITRWAGAAMPTPIVLVSIVALLLGIVLFLIGITSVAILMRLAALRIWRKHRRAYHALGPLWKVLHEHFPQDALTRAPLGTWRDTLSTVGTHRRYYRRVIECRDGLVRISPYLPPNADTTELAHHLREALHSYTSGTKSPTQATRVAVPADTGLDADVDQLIALSTAVARSTRPPWGNA